MSFIKHQEDKGSLFVWTKHSQAKMRQYMLSESRVKRVIRNPKRVEEGIAPKTLASMQKAGSKKHPYEIWVMYVIEKSKVKKDPTGSRKRLQKSKFGNKIRVISAWKYPGITKPGDPIPIPPDIFEEIMISLAKTSLKAKSER